MKCPCKLYLKDTTYIFINATVTITSTPKILCQQGAKESILVFFIIKVVIIVIITSGKLSSQRLLHHCVQLPQACFTLFHCLYNDPCQQEQRVLFE